MEMNDYCQADGEILTPSRNHVITLNLGFHVWHVYGHLLSGFGGAGCGEMPTRKQVARTVKHMCGGDMFNA